MSLYAIGDIQGCLRALDALLGKLAFDPGKDRLWLVGDLVNRGPDSLGVLRRVIGFGDAVTCVLGNHDLHLLAAAAGGRAVGPGDTFRQVLDAPDASDLLDWLRHRPLLHVDAEAGRLLVHAGIPPVWSLKQAMREAARVTESLCERDWGRALRDMYGNRPRSWSDEMNAAEKRRYTINGLTRMRYCDRDGCLDLNESGPPGTQPPHLRPWFDLPRRKPLGYHVVFGHWSALGFMRRADVTALDTGCIWGGALTAMDLDHPDRVFQSACRR
jgi:bis(5'-nucleosyl)-tetraphosphatase (symmetrical)